MLDLKLLFFINCKVWWDLSGVLRRFSTVAELFQKYQGPLAFYFVSLTIEGLPPIFPGPLNNRWLRIYCLYTRMLLWITFSLMHSLNFWCSTNCGCGADTGGERGWHESLCCRPQRWKVSTLAPSCADAAPILNSMRPTMAVWTAGGSWSSAISMPSIHGLHLPSIKWSDMTSANLVTSGDTSCSAFFLLLLRSRMRVLRVIRWTWERSATCSTCWSYYSYWSMPSSGSFVVGMCVVV